MDRSEVIEDAKAALAEARTRKKVTYWFVVAWNIKLPGSNPACVAGAFDDINDAKVRALALRNEYGSEWVVSLMASVPQTPYPSA